MVLGGVARRAIGGHVKLVSSHLPRMEAAAFSLILSHQISMDAQSIVARLRSAGLFQTKGLIGGKWADADDGKTIKGALNVVMGNAPDIGDALLASSQVRKITFTGSTAVGKKLMEGSAKTVKKVSLELGGNAPCIVFDDADLDVAIKGAGPLINEAAVQKVESFVEDAISKGAKVLLGGKRHSLGMTFYEPTVISDVKGDMLLSREEIFGPVAPLIRFKTEEEAIHIANDTNAGLTAYVFTNNTQRTWHVSEALEYGLVGVNEGLIATTEVAPFGGFKQSGLGREGSKYGMDDYLEAVVLWRSVHLKQQNSHGDWNMHI